MAEAFLGEIRIFGFTFNPRGWALCNGQLLPINQNQALFAILGTTYGGDGRTTFALPNFQGRVPFHVGNAMVLGQAGGEAAHTLLLSEMPAHTHTANGSSAPATASDPAGNLWAAGQQNFTTDPPNNVMNNAAITFSGQSQSHENRSPFLVLNFCIALAGIFPARN